MNLTPYCGRLVRLAIYDPEKDAALFARWDQNSEYQRLQSMAPCNLWTQKMVADYFEKELDGMFLFTIHTVSNDRTIGSIDLSKPDLAGNAWVGIGIGERQDWNKGYGTEAMQLAVDFGFRELNLQRISLSTFEFNPRAVRSYEKVGFQHEGRQRQFLLHDGRRWDLIIMGILRSEWEQARSGLT